MTLRKKDFLSLSRRLSSSLQELDAWKLLKKQRKTEVIFYSIIESIRQLRFQI